MQVAGRAGEASSGALVSLIPGFPESPDLQCLPVSYTCSHHGQAEMHTAGSQEVRGPSPAQHTTGQGSRTEKAGDPFPRLAD